MASQCTLEWFVFLNSLKTLLSMWVPQKCQNNRGYKRFYARYVGEMSLFPQLTVKKFLKFFLLGLFGRFRNTSHIFLRSSTLNFEVKWIPKSVR